MTDHLSLDDIRRWLSLHVKKGRVTVPSAHRGRELPTRALARAVGIHWTELHGMRDGKVNIGRRHRAVLSRFIRDWENGLLEFETLGKKGGYAASKRVLVHRATPRPRAMTMSVSWKDGAKLTIAPRPAANPRIPQFKDIFAGLKSRI